MPSWVGDGIDQRRVGVAERVDGDPAEEVEVLACRVVPHAGALAPHQREARVGRTCS